MKIEAVRPLVTSAAGKEIDLGRHSGGDGSWRGTMLNNAAVTATVVPDKYLQACFDAIPRERRASSSCLSLSL